MAGKTRIFLVESFQKFADKSRVSEHDLVAAIERAEFGLVDADLGAGVI